MFTKDDLPRLPKKIRDVAKKLVHERDIAKEEVEDINHVLKLLKSFNNVVYAKEELITGMSNAVRAYAEKEFKERLEGYVYKFERFLKIQNKLLKEEYKYEKLIKKKERILINENDKIIAESKEFIKKIVDIFATKNKKILILYEKFLKGEATPQFRYIMNKAYPIVMKKREEAKKEDVEKRIKTLMVRIKTQMGLTKNIEGMLKKRFKEEYIAKLIKDDIEKLSKILENEKIDYGYLNNIFQKELNLDVDVEVVLSDMMSRMLNVERDAKEEVKKSKNAALSNIENFYLKKSR